MQQANSAVLTHVRGELTSPERGHRAWAYAEIRDTRWYQVETCSHVRGTPDITTFITTDLKEALQMLSSLRRNSWTVFRLYCRLPHVEEKGFVFETVRKVYANQDDSYLFLLDNGLMVTERRDSAFAQVTLANVREIYPRNQ